MKNENTHLKREEELERITVSSVWFSGSISVANGSQMFVVIYIKVIKIYTLDFWNISNGFGTWGIPFHRVFELTFHESLNNNASSSNS